MYDCENQPAGYAVYCDNIEHPDQQAQAIVPSDQRILMWELARPKLDSLLKITPDARQPNEQAKEIVRIFESSLEDLLTPDISNWLCNISHDRLDKLYDGLNKDITEGNGWIVMYNPILTALLGSNTAAYPMGNAEQSNNTLFYLSPYATKNKVVLKDCVNVLHDWYKQVVVTESVQSNAADSKTVEQQTAFQMTCLINHLDMMMEISDTQAAASLLGYGPEMVSDSFTYVGPLEHANHIFYAEKHKVELCNELIEDKARDTIGDLASNLEDFIENDNNNNNNLDEDTTHANTMEDFVVSPDI